MKRMIAMIVVVPAIACIALAQQQTRQNQVYVMQAQPGARIADTEVGFAVVTNGVDFLGDGKTIKGSPYAADSTTETVQMLADGNRIMHTSNSKIYRDSEGRTRRELGPGAQRMTMATIQPGMPALVGDHSEVFISDPIADVSYSLDPEARTARKMPIPKVVVLDNAVQGGGVLGGPLGSATITARRMNTERALADGGAATEGMGWVMVRPQDKLGEASTESLGTRNIEGVEAQGKRYTATIPAGKIGNELPIVITQETWFSPKLQAVVLAIRHDPRFGDTTYKLTNISLAEPTASLFQVPSDYTVTDVKTLMEQKVMRLKNDKDRFE